MTPRGTTSIVPVATKIKPWPAGHCFLLLFSYRVVDARAVKCVSESGEPCQLVCNHTVPSTRAPASNHTHGSCAGLASQAVSASNPFYMALTIPATGPYWRTPFGDVRPTMASSRTGRPSRPAASQASNPFTWLSRFVLPVPTVTSDRCPLPVPTVPATRLPAPSNRRYVLATSPYSP